MNVLEKTNGLQRMMYSIAARKGIPIAAALELTPLCNLSCRMCYARLSPERVRDAGGLVPVSRWIEIADEAKAAGVLFFQLTGGEPFAYPGFFELYDHLIDGGRFVTINSNATLIDRDIADKLAEKSPGYVTVTIYGASNDTYERLCGARDGFDRFDRGIRLLTERGIKIQLNYSITPYNCGDIAACVNYAKSHALPLRATTYMFPENRRNTAFDTETDRFTPEEAMYYDLYQMKCRISPEHFKLIVESATKAVGCENECEDAVPPDTSLLKMPCHAGRSVFWVDWQQKVFPCGLFRGVGGYSLTEMSINDAWQRIRADVEAVRMPTECAVCSFRSRCHKCAAKTYCETGCASGKPEYVCRMIKSRDEQLARLLSHSDDEDRLQ